MEASPRGIALRVSTGDAVADAVLRGLIGSFEAAFPGRARGYYLKGSFADGSAVATSDLDVDVLFAGDLAPGEAARARALIRERARHSALPLDVGVSGERRYLEFGDVDLKLAAVPLFGEDIRERVPLLPVELWARALAHGVPRFMARARGAGESALLAVPLDYPDPAGEFFGYDRRRIRGRDGVEGPTTKDLVRVATGAAAAIVCWRAKRHVARKTDAVRLYRETEGGAWADLLEELDATCRARHHYRLPEGAADRAAVRELCRRALDFESHFLAVLREQLLHDLAGAADLGAAARWVPAEVAALLMDRPPDAVRASAATGALPCDGGGGRLVIDTRTCLQAAAARLFGRVRYVGDAAVGDALREAAESEIGDLRAAAAEALAAALS